MFRLKPRNNLNLSLILKNRWVINLDANLGWKNATLNPMLTLISSNVKAHANGRNKCQQLPTLLGVVGQQCCVCLHGPKSLTGFKLYATSAKIVVVPCKRTQQVTTLLGPTMLGVVGQQCCVCLHGPKSLTGFKLYTTSANIVVVPCKRTQQVTTLLGPTMLGAVGQQCWVHLHGPLRLLFSLSGVFG